MVNLMLNSADSFWFDLWLVVLSAASYYAAGHLSYIKILARLQGLGE